MVWCSQSLSSWKCWRVLFLYRVALESNSLMPEISTAGQITTGFVYFINCGYNRYLIYIIYINNLIFFLFSWTVLWRFVKNMLDFKEFCIMKKKKVDTAQILATITSSFSVFHVLKSCFNDTFLVTCIILKKVVKPIVFFFCLYFAGIPFILWIITSAVENLLIQWFN